MRTSVSRKGCENRVWASLPEGHKPCRKCKEVKPFDSFDKHSGCKYGINTICKECRKPIAKAAWNKTTPEYKIWHRAKFRAKREGFPFNIEISDIKIPDVCPVLGIPFIDKHPDYSVSIDKLVPEKGYVKGNIAIMSNKANRMKSNATIEEIEKLLHYLKQL